MNSYSFLTFISMVLPKLTFSSSFMDAKANHWHKFTKLKFEDAKCKDGWPYWIWIPSFVLTIGNLGEVMEVDKQLELQYNWIPDGGYGSWQSAGITIQLETWGRLWKLTSSWNYNTIGNLGEVMEVDKQLEFKPHTQMQVEFISNNVDVMTHDCLSSVALA